MRWRACGILGASLALIGPTQPAVGAGEGVYCEFTMKMTLPGRFQMEGQAGRSRGIPSEMRGKIWRSGKNARLELAMGAQRNQVTISTPAALCTLLPYEKIATRQIVTPKTQRAIDINGSPFLLVTPLAPVRDLKNPKKVGAERVFGADCDLWTADVPGTGLGTLKIWLPRSRQPAAPLKAEVSMPMPVRRGGFGGDSGPVRTMTRVMTVTRWERKRAIPDSKFAVPKGYLIRDVGAAPARPDSKP